MKLGNITKRGKNSWRIKIELPRDPVTGERRAHFETIGQHLLGGTPNLRWV